VFATATQFFAVPSLRCFSAIQRLRSSAFDAARLASPSPIFLRSFRSRFCRKMNFQFGSFFGGPIRVNSRPIHLPRKKALTLSELDGRTHPSRLHGCVARPKESNGRAQLLPYISINFRGRIAKYYAENSFSCFFRCYCRSASARGSV